MAMKTFFLLLFGLLCAGAAGAAGFDCKAAASITEKRICSDPALSHMDEALAATYRTALASMDDANRKIAAAAQKAWLNKTRSLCDDTACLRDVYATRIQLLAHCAGMCSNTVEAYAHGGDTYNLVTLLDAQSMDASFNASLVRRKLAPISGCTNVVDAAVGTAHGNHSFGGLCRVKGGSGFVMVCNDLMIGHFGYAQAPAGATRNDLADFTIDNCFGG
jgi:uncharacterized protein